MLLQPYLNFDGQCRAAFTFYQQVLGGKIENTETYVDEQLSSQPSRGWRRHV